MKPCKMKTLAFSIMVMKFADGQFEVDRSQTREKDWIPFERQAKFHLFHDESSYFMTGKR